MRKWIGALALGAALLAASAIAAAVEVGQSAPDFNLPATTGTNVSLKDYRGKSWVLIEFYGADFVPT